MADYVVNYQINVNSQAALNSIRQFQEAAQSLSALTSTFDSVTKKIGKVNSTLSTMGKRVPVLKVNTTNIETKLNQVLNKLSALKKAANFNLKVSGQVGKVTTSVKTLETTMSQLRKDIDYINKKPITPKANVAQANRNLQSLIKNLQKVRSLSNVAIAAVGGGGGRSTFVGTTGGSNSKAPKAPKAPKAGHSTLLYPTTRQVLGPTYAGTGTNIMGEMVKGMGVAYGVSAVMSGIAGVFKDAVAYNNISQTTKNILGAHDKRFSFEKDFEEMNALMRQVGVDTRFTAPEVAGAGKYLAMAGYKVEDIKRSIRPITDVALIGDTELGLTADVMTNIMTSYKMPAEQISKASDILTMTFTKTNTTLLDLAESFKYAGTMAYQSGLSFETSSAALGVLGDAGIKGSQAGTTLRMMLMNMMNPTKKQKEAWKTAGVRVDDGDGNMRDLTDILLDLQKVRQTMSAYNFASLISKMFRVTASPGALALINNAQKVREVMEANVKSAGLSSDLALAKQNTIQGLWYQLTSAFTDAGMTGFGKMQGKIKAFLQEVIDHFKSPEFINALGSVMEFFVKLTKIITNFISYFTSVWNAFPEWVKNSLAWLIKFQMYIRMITGTAQMFLSVFVSIRGLAMGSWFISIIAPIKSLTKAFLGLGAAIQASWVTYFNTGHGLKKGVSAAFKQFGANMIGTIAGAEVGSRVSGNIIGTVASPFISSTTTNASINTAKTVAASAAGASAGHTSLLSWIFSPIGAAFTGVSVALGGMIYYLRQFDEAARKSREAALEWAESINHFGITKDTLKNNDDIIIGNMRIYNSELLTQNKRLEEAVRLYNLYYEAKNKEPQTTKDGTPYFKTTEGKQLASHFDFISPLSNNSVYFKELWESLGIKKEGDHYRVGSLSFGKYDLTDDGRLEYIDNDEARIAALYAQGKNPNNQWAKKLNKALLDYMPLASSHKNAKEYYDELYKKYFTDPMANPWNIDYGSSALEMASAESIFRIPVVHQGFRDQMTDVMNGWLEFTQLLDRADKGKPITQYSVQKYLRTAVGPLLDPVEYGLVGTPAWIHNVQSAINNPKKYGFDSDQVVYEAIAKSFEIISELYNKAPQKYRYMYAPFLNAGLWGSFMPKEGMLPAGGYTPGDQVASGNKAGSKMKANGKVYEWTTMPNWHTPMWMDKDGNMYLPANINNAGFMPVIPGAEDNNLGGEGGDDFGKGKYSSVNSSPKQVIVRIENLMNVENVDMTDERKAAVVTNLKEEMAQALVEVVSGFSHDFHG